MKTSLLLKLLQKINTDEFLKQELENLFGKDAIPSMFTSFTDEQFEDLLKSKGTRQILYKIYMYVKGDKLPQELKKLVDDKIARRGCFIHTACDMLYMFNNEELLKREDIHQIFELIINAPLPQREYIVNAFKEVDLSKRDNIVEFINIILTAKGDKQAEYASKAYVAIMKEIAKNFAYPSIYSAEYIGNLKANVLPITEIIANFIFGYDAEYIYNFVTEKPNHSEKAKKMISCPNKAAWPEIKVIIEKLRFAKGKLQTEILEETYKKMVKKLWHYDANSNNYPGEMRPVINCNLLGVIGDAVGPVQAQAVADYLLSITDFQDEETILKNATTIANWLETPQIPVLIKWFGYDTALWGKYASQIPFWESKNKVKILMELAELKKYNYGYDNGIVDKVIETLSNMEDNSIDTTYVGDLSHIILESGILGSKYFSRYLKALLKTKIELSNYLIIGYMIGAKYIEEIENPSVSRYRYISLIDIFMFENRNCARKHVMNVINILEETGIGFITDLDDEESVKMVERIANSQQPIEVTLKELMKLPADVVEQALKNTPDEVDHNGKIFIIKPNTIKEMNNED